MAFILTLAFVNGCATVISKMINYRCTKYLGTNNGSLVNYVVASVLSFVFSVPQLSCFSSTHPVFSTSSYVFSHIFVLSVPQQTYIPVNYLIFSTSLCDSFHENMVISICVTNFLHTSVFLHIFVKFFPHLPTFFSTSTCLKPLKYLDF